MERVTGRERARRHLFLAIVLLVAAAFALRFRTVGPLQLVGPTILFLLVAYAAGSALWWAAAALRDRRQDPWAYDPVLDGPVAEAIEGRSYLRPPGPPPPPRPASHTWTFLALAVVFAAAGVWLVTVAGSTYTAANGAEGPTLSAFAFYLFAAAFFAASPWMAWNGLRRAR